MSHETEGTLEEAKDMNDVTESDTALDSNEKIAKTSAVDEAKIAELRILLAEQEGGRPHEFVKTLVLLAEAVPDNSEKVELYEQAADLFANKIMNPAEAMRLYESIIEIQVDHPAAIAFLEMMYDKRRDWEKLISLKQNLADCMPDAYDRAFAYKELAALATERVKKPEFCSALWSVVIENDPNDIDALQALSQLYERARDFDALVPVLDRLAEVTPDANEQIQLLTKLGAIVGDRLKDDEKAADVYRKLLTLSPGDRRAEEQLKKRYLALGRWDELEQLYAESGKWDDFIRLLESNEGRAETSEQRIGMLIKIAELWITQKGATDRAARSYEKILTIDESNLEAAERLIPIYQDADNARGLVKAYEAKLTHISDPGEKVELLRLTAEIYEVKLNDKASALRCFISAVETAPEDDECAAQLAELAGRCKAWDQVVTLYQSVLSAGEVDSLIESKIRIRLGNALLLGEEDVDAALEQFLAVSEADPTNDEALAALEQLYRRTERFEELLSVYEKRRALASSPEEAKTVLLGLADLYANHLDKKEDAAAVYEELLSNDPTDADVLSALDSLLVQLQSWAQLAEVLQRRVEISAEPDAIVELKSRLATILDSKLGDPSGALEQYRELVYMDPENSVSQLALEKMVQESDNPLVQAEAAVILEGIYEVRGDWTSLIRILSILVEGTATASRQVELLRKSSQIFANQMGDSAGAFEALSEALAIDPTLDDARVELEGYAIESGKQEELGKLYANIAGATDDPSLARTYCLRLATIYEEVGNVDGAAAAYTQLLSVEPGDEEALLALDGLYRGAGLWEELAGIYRLRVEEASPGEKEGLLIELAELLETSLEDEDAAIAAYREVVALDPSQILAHKALANLYQQTQNWEALCECLSSQLDLAESEDEALRTMIRLSEIRERNLKDVAGAISGYREILERDPFNEAGAIALERLLQLEEWELDVSEILEPLYRQRGEYEKLIDVLEVQVRRAEDVGRAVSILQQIAQLCEDALGNFDRAMGSYIRALGLDPSDANTMDNLDRLCRVTGQFERLASSLNALALEQEDSDISCALNSAAAKIFAEDLGQNERAIELYQNVVKLQPDNVEVVSALEVLFEAAGRYAELAAVLVAKAAASDDEVEKKNALLQAANVQRDVLNEPEKAIEALYQVLEIEPDDLEALDALIELLLQQESWKALLEAQSKKADLVFDPDEKKVIYYQMGAVYERELGDVDSAIDTYQKVLELMPDDIDALGRLDALYQATANWQELLTILTHESDLCGDPIEAVSYQFRIGEIYETRLKDVSRAVDLYRDILAIQLDHQPTLSALDRIQKTEEFGLLAAQVLEPIYEALGNAEALVGTLETQVLAADDAYTKVELLQRIAVYNEESLANLEGAFDACARAVAADPGNEDTLGSLERMAMLTENWEQTAQVYDAQLEALVTEPEQLVSLALRVAQIYEVQLEKYELAIARYSTALETDPVNQAAIGSLDRLYGLLERWSDLADILERQAEIGETPDDILGSKFRLGEVRQLNLGDIDGAIEVYGSILASEPDHSDARNALESLFSQGQKLSEIALILEPIYEASAEWERLIELRIAQLSQIANVDERLELYYRIAEDAEERMLDEVRAFEIYAAALTEVPSDERCATELERLAGVVAEGWEQLCHHYANLMGVEGIEETTLALIGKRLARVFEQELGDVEKAEEAYRYVLSVALTDEETLENLDRIYSQSEQHESLAGILEKRILVSDDDILKIDLCQRLGELYEFQLGQVDFSIRAYRLIFDELEEHNRVAIESLTRLYAASEAWDQLKLVFERELEHAMGDVEEAEVRAKLAHLAVEHLDDIDGALELWRRVQEIRGEDPEALLALADIYNIQERWAELSDVLDQLSDIATEDEHRIAGLSRRAKLFTERLGRDDEALETWQRVLEIDYENAEALLAIADIWRRRGEPSELAIAIHAIVDRAGPVLDLDTLADLFRELAQTYGTKLQQAFDAEEAWTKLLELLPHDFEAMQHLEAYYRADGRWEDVFRIKMQRGGYLGEDAERVSEYLDAAEIWRSHGAYEKAIPAFEAVVGIEPAHEQSYKELDKLYARVERWDALIELYLGRLERESEPAIKAEVLRKIAVVFEEKLGDAEQAFEALINAFAEDYGDDKTVRYLERLAQSMNKWTDLINTSNTWLEGEEDKKRRIQLCLRLGKWYGEDLSHPDYAKHYYAQVNALDPQNAQVLRQWASMYRRSGNWAAMGQTLQKALDVAVSVEDRKTILFDMGDLLEKHMGQADNAIDYYRRALDTDSHFVPALQALERLYGERKQHHDLAEVLQKALEISSKDEELVGPSLRLASLYETTLEDPEKALRYYKKVLELSDTNIQGLRGVERLATRLDNWSLLAESLQKQLEVVEVARERVDTLVKLGNVLEIQFLKLDEAAERYESALDIDVAEVRAYEGLERCYRRTKSWLDLVTTYERHIAEIADYALKIELSAAIAKIYLEEVRDEHQAISAYEKIVDLEPNHIEGHDSLAKLYEKVGDAHRSVEHMRRVADLTTDGSLQIDTYFRIGRVLEGQLGDRFSAKESFELALNLDPNHLPSLAAVRGIAVDDCDWDAACEILGQEINATENPRARAALLVALGEIKLDKLYDASGAVVCFEEAIELDDDCAAAAKPLIQVYIEARRWNDALPLAEILVRHEHSDDRDEQKALHLQVGMVQLRAGKYQDALSSYQAAHQLDMADTEPTRGIAEAAFYLEDWATSLTNYQKMLNSLPEEDYEGRTEVYYRLGRIKAAQGQARQAVNNYEKALALSAEHRPTLDAMVKLYEQAGDWKQVGAYLRQIIDTLYDQPEARMVTLDALCDVWWKKANEPQKAIEALEEVNELNPGNHSTLHKLMQLYQSVDDWHKMIETIRVVADIESDTLKKARYTYTIAQLYRDKLDETERSVEHFNETLDLNPDYLEAFERISRILTKEKEWKQLERSYRKMLHRVSGKGKLDIEFNLWHQLGIIYRDRMNEHRSAIEAFKMASVLKPQERLQKQILAELYQANQQFDEAIVERRALLELDPLNPEGYDALYRLFIEMQAYDEAWCTAAALHFLRKTDADQEQFFLDWRPQGMQQFRGAFSPEIWNACVIHPAGNAHISAIFEAIAPAAARAKIAEMDARREPRLPNQKYRQDPATSTVTFARTYDNVAKVLGMVTPELYIRNDADGYIGAAVSIPFASVAGKSVLSGFSPQELTFICGKHLTQFRGEQFIRTLFPTQSELMIMLFAAMSIVDPSTPLPQEMAAQIAPAAQALARNMDAQSGEVLRRAVKRFKDDGAQANVKRWIRSAEHTTERAGFVMAGDLDIAKKIIGAEQSAIGGLSVSDRVRELLIYSVSGEYMNLRKALGLQIQVNAEG